MLSYKLLIISQLVISDTLKLIFKFENIYYYYTTTSCNFPLRGKQHQNLVSTSTTINFEVITQTREKWEMNKTLGVLHGCSQNRTVGICTKDVPNCRLFVSLRKHIQTCTGMRSSNGRFSKE